MSIRGERKMIPCRRARYEGVKCRRKTLTAAAVVAAAVLVLTMPTAAWAAPIAMAYPSFNSADASTFDFYGDGRIVGDVIHLTDADEGRGGQAFTKQTIDLGATRSFSSQFTFLMSNGGGIALADGLTFTVKRADVTTLIPGGGLGYMGVSPSVAVEFDTWANWEYGDIDDNHAGVNVDGSLASVAQASMPFYPYGVPTYVWVDYNGETDLLEVRVAATSTRPVSPLISHTIDLTAVVGQYVNVGFTAGTGAGWQTHDIQSLYFSAEYVPTGLDSENNTYTFGAHALAGSVSATPVTAGRSATVTALVTDIGGNPLAGQAVSFSGPGAFAAASGLTNASGQYSTAYTPPPVPGGYTVHMAGPDSVQDDVNVEVVAAKLAAAVSPGEITGGRSTSVVATVLDLGGQPMAGMPLTFSVTGGTLSSASGTTNSAGQCSVTFTPPAAPGTYRVTITGPNGMTATVDVTVVPPTASIKFRGSSYRLTSATKAELSRLAQHAASINATVIVLEGHAAQMYRPGTSRWRARLSSLRASAARSYLLRQLRRYGSNATVTITWYGADVPIADNRTAAGRSLNRRVDAYMR